MLDSAIVDTTLPVGTDGSRCPARDSRRRLPTHARRNDTATSSDGRCPPSDAALRLIGGLAEGVRQILMVADADLGGVRISYRVVAALDRPHAVRIIDVGLQAHTERAPFGPHSVAGLRAAAADPAVGAFATACLHRGYPVEQEESTPAAVNQALLQHPQQTD